MADKNKVAEQYYAPPPDLGKWEAFRIFLWNSETGQVLGRTGSSWAKILLFYLIFYAILVGFFAAMLAIFYQTLDSKMPKWQMDGSLIGSNPGLGFRPMPDSANVESTLIYYRANDKGSVLKWATVIDEFLEQYRKKGSGGGEASGAENRVPCSPSTGALGEKQVCDVPVDKFNPCTSANQYNYEQAGPCVFLKLNKIFNWTPQPYNTTEDLPTNMPEDLKHHIKTMEGKPDANMVWVSCQGENPADVENIGPIQYIPGRGFPSYYYPFTNKEGYLSPLVAVLFEKPRTGVLINIECKAWAKNIFYDRYERRGSVHFELMVDRS
ncbi:Sodium/potassium-transporting ATPase subunit beta-2 [Papilio machaon]|uniref:Sodium/potassium-transporting ATPase subunit beta-2 n=1 Tax=Papilio machaon TaxID=76193 RepID=A0A194RBK0_PAPMA|nr:sodium/potassium-transporting ATPase subunit beta-2 [Papilio machaon]KPJ13276.1 Sodium/potassium-transporting ATPase subunit beta-2 [Papilio machaon]